MKVRGYRIELAEIERVLEQKESIREAAVIVREDNPGDKRLVAYVVVEGENEQGTKELRGYLEEKLPYYMMPSAIVLMERMPLTPNGKLDRKALPRPEQMREEGEGSSVGFRTPVEEILAGIFEEALKLNRVGRNDNFFEAGGHSLLATQVVSRVKNRFGVEIGVRSIFLRSRQ